MLSVFLKSTLIYIIALFMILLSCTPAYNHVVLPDFIVLVAFSILAYEGCRISIVPLLGIALLKDYIIGGVIGISLLKISIIMLLISSNQKAFLEQKFNIKWLGFIILVGICVIMELAAQYTVMQHIVINSLNFAQYLSTVFAFPIYYLLFYQMMKRR